MLCEMNLGEVWAQLSKKDIASFIERYNAVRFRILSYD